MHYKNKLLTLLGLSLLSTSIFADIPYCKGTQVTTNEGKVMQTLVMQFADKMQCKVGKNCLLKWGDQAEPNKFSIAWQSACGPVINGVPQLGDNGKGSTFVCHTAAGNTCCWPLGYDYAPEYVICSNRLKG